MVITQGRKFEGVNWWVCQNRSISVAGTGISVVFSRMRFMSFAYRCSEPRSIVSGAGSSRLDECRMVAVW